MILGFGTCLFEDILSDIDMQKGSSSILYFTLSAALLKVSGLRHHHTLHCTAQNWLVLMLFKNIRWDLGTSINKGFEPPPKYTNLNFIDFFILCSTKLECRMRAIITYGLYIFYSIFHCGLYCSAVYNAEQLIILFFFGVTIYTMVVTKK